MEHNDFQFPEWMKNLSKADLDHERIRFVLRYAALLGTQVGSITELSRAIGLHMNTLSSSLSQGRYDEGLPVAVIFGIEKLIGPGVIPRDVMNPKVYGMN